MSKSYEYVNLITKLDKLELSDSLIDDAYARGNIAYLVDSYFDSEEQKWKEIVQKIDKLIEENNVNELCYFIASKIYESAIASDIINGTVKRLYSTEMDLRKSLYTTGDLKDFDLVVDFPYWFYTVDIF